MMMMPTKMPTDDELRLELGRRGREQVLSRYRTSMSVDAYRELYAQLTSNGRSTSSASS